VRLSLAALFAAACLACLPAARCSSPFSRPGSARLTIVAYNVKSLFDDKDDGPEFPEFSVAKGKWDAARYGLRLRNVAEAVLATAPRDAGPPGPDVLCLEEIENGRVLEALRSGPLAAARYKYSAIAPAEDGPFSVCVLSRLPILSERCLSAATPAGREGRDALELELDAEGRRLFLIACHWKSKLGGDELTEEARREAAALVRSRVEELVAVEPGAELLVCGDLNESPGEYEKNGRRYATALMPLEEAAAGGAASARPGGRSTGASAKLAAARSSIRPSRLLVASSKELAGMSGGEIVLYSPWEESGGYSFSFRGSRERIDNFLLAPGLLDGKGLSFERFSAAPAPFLVDGAGTPIAWPGSGAKGYSDHLPILLVLGYEKGS
jgi:endonuclease/exonuclease/phosphatase family metal-dependent hydrolase